MRQKKTPNVRNGQATIIGLMILMVSGVISLGVVLIQDSMTKHRRMLRVKIAKNSLVQEIDYILKNPLSYTDYTAVQLSTEVIEIVNNTSRKIAGIPCGESGNECKIQSTFVSADNTLKTVNYAVNFLGTSPRIKVKEYSLTLPASTSLSNKICMDSTAPLLDGIDAAGNPVCRSLVNTTCSTGQYLIGINSNLSAICADIEDRNISVPADQYIKSYKWNKSGNTLTLSALGALRELSNIVTVANSFELGPITFYPRPGTDITGPTVGNTYFPRQDSKALKCPDAYPIISFKSVTGNGGISCVNYATNESLNIYICAYAKGDNVQREVKLTYVCSKRP